MLLREALAHRSWCAENPEQPSNERLEFLGDAVLGLVVTDHIFGSYPDMAEGDLAKIRAALVNATTLSEVAEEIGLGEALMLGKGELASGGREKPSILADALEAVIGAIYLDAGHGAATRTTLDLLGPRVEMAASGPEGHDAKTRLQELVARSGGDRPDYSVTDHGPDHAKTFSAEVSVDGRVMGEGTGRSKKQAEQEAARVAFDQLSARGAPTTRDSEHTDA